ncbi:MAG: OmpL47-type beta-barrel domain-containing protein, partial [Promethearchaeota archaeon]
VEVRDITDPITTLTFQPQFGAEAPYYVSTTTEFVLTAEDNSFGSGIDIIQYKIGNEAEWSTFIGLFSISDIGGPYTVYYRSTDIAGNTEEAKSVDVIVNASELSYDGEITGDYSDPVILEATLIDMATQELISDKTIIFTIGTQTINAETINGVACVTLILDQPGGDYTVSASFLNDGEYLASSDESAFTINKENALAEYTGNLVVSTNADTITLRATIFDEIDGNWGDLTKIFVNISILNSWTLEILYTSGALQVETTVVEGVGIAIITIPNTLPEEGYFINISFDPDENDYYCGDTTDFVTLIIYEPIGDFVTGGGWIEDADGNKGNFGFNVKYKKNGLPKGQAIFVYKEGDYTVIVKANAWVGMAIISEDNYTIFEAKCNVKKIDRSTGEIIWEEGNYRLVIEAWDNSNNGKEDVIQIRVYDKIGIVFHEAGFDPYGILGGGNIVIHIDEKTL